MLFVLHEGRVGEIGKACEFRLEGELHRAGRSMALLGDDDVGRAASPYRTGLPTRRISGRCRIARLLVLDVVFLAEDEQHHVGVLLDRTGFAQVRKLRALVVAAFDLHATAATGR